MSVPGITNLFNFCQNMIAFMIIACLFISTVLIFYKGKYVKKIRIARLIAALIVVIGYAILGVVSIKIGLPFAIYIINIAIGALLSGYFFKSVKR